MTDVDRVERAQAIATKALLDDDRNEQVEELALAVLAVVTELGVVCGQRDAALSREQVLADELRELRSELLP
jgi:hypothetical protein